MIFLEETLPRSGQKKTKKTEKNTEKLQIFQMGVNHLKQPDILILKKMRIEDTYMYTPPLKLI